MHRFIVCDKANRRMKVSCIDHLCDWWSIITKKPQTKRTSSELDCPIHIGSICLFPRNQNSCQDGKHVWFGLVFTCFVFCFVLSWKLHLLGLWWSERLIWWGCKCHYFFYLYLSLIFGEVWHWVRPILRVHLLWQSSHLW